MPCPEETTQPNNNNEQHRDLHGERQSTARGEDLRPPRSDGDRRRYFAGAAGALLLAAGLGTVGIAQSSANAGADAATATRSTTVGDNDSTVGPSQRSAPVSADLDDVMLDELADELERLGLKVRIAPAEAESTESGSDAVSAGAETDPFQGMSDEEIDALSDEEFFAMLEEAGIESDYDDSYDETGSNDGDFDGEDVDDDDFSDDDFDDHDHDAGDEAPLATVAVNGDDIDTSGLSADVARQTEEIWQRFVALIPADQRQMVANFELMPGNYGGAHVYPTDADPTKWTLGVSADMGDDLDYVLVHEFGHLLTLQAKEVPPGDDDGSCPTYHTGEGCALKGSTFADFVAAFWPQEMRDKVLDLYESEDYDGLEAFYEQNKDSFVTDYAASNPAEDLAETFAVFVTEDRPTGNTIADQKVELLWSDPSMVELRNQIRAAL